MRICARHNLVSRRYKKQHQSAGRYPFFAEQGDAALQNVPPTTKDANSGGKLDAQPPPCHFINADSNHGFHTVSSVWGKEMHRRLASLNSSRISQCMVALALRLGLAATLWCSSEGSGSGNSTGVNQTDKTPVLARVTKGTFRPDTNDPNRLRFLLRLQSVKKTREPQQSADQQGFVSTITFRELVYEDGTIWHQLMTIEGAQLLFHVIDNAVPPPRRMLVGSDGTWQTWADVKERSNTPPSARWSRDPSTETHFVIRRTQNLVDPSRLRQETSGLATPCADAELAALAQRKNPPKQPTHAAAIQFPEDLTLPHPPVTHFFRLAEWVCLQVTSK